MTNATRNEAIAVAEAQYALVRPLFLGKMLLVAVLVAAIYWRPFKGMYYNWTLTESYYSHGFLIPLISLFFAWRRRAVFLKLEPQPCLWGYPLILGASLLLLMGDFLSFDVFRHLSFVVLLPGLFLVLLGKRHTALMWFPLLFLVFMVPIPGSVTQSMALRLKLLATKCAVVLAKMCTLPMVQEGSFVHFGDDQLLVGEVCGGLRSLIALLAFGALMSYLSKTRPWAKVLLLLLSAPIAIIANVFRIFLLCVVGYFWGSGVAAGKFHDISGLLIFAVAFVLFFTVETLLRKLAPARSNKEEAA